MMSALLSYDYSSQEARPIETIDPVWLVSGRGDVPVNERKICNDGRCFPCYNRDTVSGELFACNPTEIPVLTVFK